jgi:hypothetical protein
MTSNTSKRRVISTRDVTFNEELTYKTKERGEKDLSVMINEPVEDIIHVIDLNEPEAPVVPLLSWMDSDGEEANGGNSEPKGLVWTDKDLEDDDDISSSGTMQLPTPRPTPPVDTPEETPTPPPEERDLPQQPLQPAQGFTRTKRIR